MDIRALDAYAIRRDMKKNIGFDEYLVKYNCTEQDLERRIKKLFISDSDKIIKELREISAKNKARSIRRGKKSQKQSLAAKNNGQPAADAASLPAPKDPLTVLKEQEQIHSDAVIQLESEHKRLNSQHCQCLDQMRTIQDEIEGIKKSLKEKADAYEEIAQRNNQIVQDMNDICLRRRDQLTTLEGIRQEIQALTVIEVFVYTDGNIEVVDTETSLSLNDTGKEEIYTNLISRDDLQDLRIRDIHTLAKIISITRNSDIRIQPTFEDVTLEPFYQALVA